MDMMNVKDIDMELALIRTALVGEANLRLVSALMARMDELEKERAYILYQDAA